MVKWTEKKTLGFSLRYIKFSKGLSRMFVSLAKSLYMETDRQREG